VAGRARALTRSAATCLEREAARPCVQAGVRHVVFSTLEDPSKLLPAGALPELLAHPGYVVAHFQSKAAVQVLPKALKTMRCAPHCCEPRQAGWTECAGAPPLGHPRRRSAYHVPGDSGGRAEPLQSLRAAHLAALAAWLWTWRCVFKRCMQRKQRFALSSRGCSFSQTKSDVLLPSTSFRHHGHG
jgi:hypothetical protein